MRYEANWTSVILGFCMAMGMVWVGSLSIQAPELTTQVQSNVQIARR